MFIPSIAYWHRLNGWCMRARCGAVACEIAQTFVSVEGISGITLWYQLSAHAYIRLTPAHMQQVCEEPGTQCYGHGTIGQ